MRIVLSKIFVIIISFHIYTLTSDAINIIHVHIIVKSITMFSWTDGIQWNIPLNNVMDLNNVVFMIHNQQSHYIRSVETFSCLKLIYGPQQHGLLFGSSYLNHLDMSS